MKCDIDVVENTVSNFSVDPLYKRLFVRQINKMDKRERWRAREAKQMNNNINST